MRGHANQEIEFSSLDGRMPCFFHPDEARKIKLLGAAYGGLLSMVHAAMLGRPVLSFFAWDERARGGTATALDFRKSAIPGTPGPLRSPRQERAGGVAVTFLSKDERRDVLSVPIRNAGERRMRRR